MSVIILNTQYTMMWEIELLVPILYHSLYPQPLLCVFLSTKGKVNLPTLRLQTHPADLPSFTEHRLKFQ